MGTPAMESGHFPDDRFRKACFIRQMKIADDDHSWVSPSADYLQKFSTNPLCYKFSYNRSGRDKA